MKSIGLACLACYLLTAGCGATDSNLADDAPTSAEPSSYGNTFRGIRVDVVGPAGPTISPGAGGTGPT